MEKCRRLASDLRKEIIEISYGTGRKGVHLGSALSIADVLSVLYGSIMNYNVDDPTWAERDRFILSKGHAYTALYSILCLEGFYSHEELIENFMTDGGIFPAHPIKNLNKGIECSSGSLGMGLSFAIGKALNAKKKGLQYQTYALVGDGECDEGSIWESFISAVQFKLDNLVAFIDCNKLQQDGLTCDVLNIPFEHVLPALGWNVVRIDGNDVAAIYTALQNRDKKSERPFALICDTVKGKGVSFMENNNAWHHASLSQQQYEQAMNELTKMR